MVDEKNLKPNWQKVAADRGGSQSGYQKDD
jgi:hypothetical protein